MSTKPGSTPAAIEAEFGGAPGEDEIGPVDVGEVGTGEVTRVVVDEPVQTA